ncbi:5-carboxymethyl-2-hydroxymuconate isomerase [Sphingobium indicum IP26]|uniref:5-carboxymethyl-2-hydroxymuconate isomerase n=1 Tax=Sphingobium indicum F2 TaxID=1450518 RepID=A0A8E1C1G1_9SPHN|nr:MULTISPECIES: fumarylacetoacetate hydrolase family protein [Sphingobium]EPR15186.1 5-carboxymethyl-2-hydroxymuconate isomerase [Sphingobium indicum IP26]EQB03078.1 5-carboxymethyl-2-hydroxymuconate isomerase [Sphingobium sp. HDIP04]KER34928.1 5-carboxymethyl-2-hydroxymuconate isomerase [Sphingobium indicum F2]
MKLARYSVNGTVEVGLVEEDRVVRLTGRLPQVGQDMLALISAWDGLRDAAEKLRGEKDFSLAEVELLAPIPRPGKIWGIGLNYADHAEESGLPIPEHQMWFVKASTAVAGPYQPIERPAVSQALDYEAELVAVIGRGGRHLSGARAAEAIFGYCVGNDVSVRDWQVRSGQYSIGKSFDTHAPFGPWIVTADEVDASALPIRSLVNGEVRQQSNTRHLIFDPVAQVEHLSQAMTLETGDILFTGTPGGVGAAMSPPKFLAPGDRVRVEIDGIGFIENEVMDEPGR